MARNSKISLAPIRASDRQPVPPRTVAWMRKQARADGELPRRGRPRKHFGPREPNGQASRRKGDNLTSADRWSKEADRLWTATVLGTDLFRLNLRSESLPTNPLFLNLARRCVLDIHPFKIAILWWSGHYPINGKELLRKALGIKANIDFEPESKLIKRRNEGREIAQKKLGDDFVKRMDDAIFQDKIPDVQAFLKDLIAVRDLWRAEEVRDSDRNIKEELCRFYRSEGLAFIPSKRGRRR